MQEAENLNDRAWVGPGSEKAPRILANGFQDFVPLNCLNQKNII